MPPRKKSGGAIYVATDSGAATVNKTEYVFHKGITRVREGHPLTTITGFDVFFEPVDDSVHYDVEQATAAPGEERGAAA